jgi:hypothetical protein
MVCCLNMSKPSMTRGWLAKSFDSANSSTIYQTSTSKLPILKPNSGECRRLNRL